MLEFASQSKSAQQLPMQAYSRIARSRAEIFGTDWFLPMTKSQTSSPLGDSGAKMKCAVESDREGDRLSVQMPSCLLQTLAPSTLRISRHSQVKLWWKTLRRNNSGISSSGPELVDISWKRLGVPASVAATLRSVFPHIAKPTKTQARLIPAILSGKDVLLKDHTGTGKYVGFHVSVTVNRVSDQSTKLQVIRPNLGLT